MLQCMKSFQVRFNVSLKADLSVANIGGFQLRDKTAVLVHKTIANYGSCFA